MPIKRPLQPHITRGRSLWPLKRPLLPQIMRGEGPFDINTEIDNGEGNPWTKGERTMAPNKYTNCHSSTTPTNAHLKPKLRNTGCGGKPVPRKKGAIDGSNACFNSESITRDKHTNCKFSITKLPSASRSRHPEIRKLA